MFQCFNYVKGLIKEKRRIMKLYNKHPITYGDMYRDIRNKVNNVVQSSKRNYYQSHLAENERHPRTMWKTINGMLGNNGNRNCIIQELKSSSGQITDNLDIANELNNYFAKIGSVLNAEVPPSG